MTATHIFEAWSCTVRLVVTDPATLEPAAKELESLLQRVDHAASRFRIDSELSWANASAGRPVPVSRMLSDLVGAALLAAARTDGAVDPTIGQTLAQLGYDRDIATIAEDSVTADPLNPAADANWTDVGLDPAVGLLTVPPGTALDLGATAKAYTADVAARALHLGYGTDVLVEIGGDLAVAGQHDWSVRIAETPDGDGENVTLHSGGLATSTTTRRRWSRGGRPVHHIIDPTTGQPADGPRRTATVHAGSAFDANVASTAAIVLGDRALAWLTERHLVARLVDQDGSVVTTPGWPNAHLRATA